jgi:hypothetical protein
MSTYNVGPHTVGIQIATKIAAYLDRAIQLGAFEGPVGSMTLNAALQPLADAINQVLAGGTVTVQVTTPGNPGIVSELGNLLSGGVQEANDVNKKAGYYVTLIA